MGQRSLTPTSLPTAVHSWLSGLPPKNMCGNLLGLACSCLSFVLNIVALIGTYWLNDDGPDLLHEGIWQRCSNNTCLKINGKGYVDATRTFILLSSIVLQFGLVTSCLTFYSCHMGRFTASFVACILDSISGFFLFIALVVYTWEEHLDRQNIPNISYRYGWAYFLCWLSVGFLCIAAISHYQAHRSIPQTSYEPMQEGEEGDNVDVQS
ncbi:lens fiber membrane intrinsic protein-like isoform X2 [Rana temporaria]|uniref:lens fiber membrane intrinsic protein-like isoform X2 n=1 Tax=Rana temporaria TaxID=8407 RepID=UPI001AAE0D29|nr:lens fiber membrane intrinsic protein-like isoform X2 [Rana temporaria]